MRGARGLPAAFLMATAGLGLVACLTQLTFEASTDERFALVLPELSPGAFARGGIIRAPAGPLSRLEFHLGAAAARHVTPGRIAVEVNATPLEPETIAGSGLVVRVQLAKNDLRAEGPNRIEVLVSDRPELGNRWILEHTDDLLLTETAGAMDGIPIEIALTRPLLPIIIRPGPAPTLIVEGTVNRVDARVLVNGSPPALSPRADGLSSQFTAHVTLTPAGGELIIEATGSAADYARVIVPIRGRQAATP